MTQTFSSKINIAKLIFLGFILLNIFINEPCMAESKVKARTERRKKRLHEEYTGKINIWTHHIYLTASGMNQNGTAWSGSRVRDIPVYFIQKGESGEIYRLKRRYLKSMISDNQEAMNALHAFEKVQRKGAAFYAGTAILAGAGYLLFPKNIPPLKVEHLPKIGGAIVLGLGGIATYCIARVEHQRSKTKLKDVVDIYNGTFKPALH